MSPTFPGVVSWTEDIIKPDIDDRLYRHITLPNKLEALLVSDGSTDKAAAAIDVHVGYMCDDDDIPGLAHFLEHLLFMGTEKYPEENSYLAFLNSHGGGSNAGTSLDSTNYFFHIQADYLREALDRFSGFFTCPLFDPSCTDREMRAVDSEHKGNMQEDGHRLHQIEKTLCDPKHPFQKFGTGNLDTLSAVPLSKGLDVRERLLDFYKRYYSANIMTLVVVGKESLDELTSMVVEHFSAVTNNNVEVPKYDWGPLTKDFLLKRVLVKPVMDVRQIEITFPFPDAYKWPRSRPGGYLSHLLGHEAEGSILSLLKSLSWANGMSAGVHEGSIGWSFFKIHIDMTEEGLGHVEEIVEIVFSFIQMLQSAGVQEWAFRECELMLRCEFKFQEKWDAADYASAVSGWMQKYTKREILSGPYLIDLFELDAVSECMAWLRPDNFRITVISQQVATPAPEAPWMTEHYYGTSYTVEPLDQSFLDRCFNPKSWTQLHLPAKNIFIPEDLLLKYGPDQTAPMEQGDQNIVNPITPPTTTQRKAFLKSRPRLVRNDTVARIWHKMDRVFSVPKVNMLFDVRTRQVSADARSTVLAELYVELVKDSLQELSHFSNTAGLYYTLDAYASGITVGFNGYNDKISLFVHKVAERVRTLEVDPARFKVIAEIMSRSYKNFDQQSPSAHASFYADHLMLERRYTCDERLEALQGVTAADVQGFYPKLLSHGLLVGFVHGNMYAYETLALVETLVETLQIGSASPEDAEWTLGSAVLPTPSSFVYERNVPNPDDVNSAILYYVQCGDPLDRENRLRMLLLDQIISEPAFDQLRTKEQLGYIVSTQLELHLRMVGLSFTIQSEKAPRYLEDRIDEFLKQFLEKLESLSSEEFERHKQTLVAKSVEEDKNLSMESNRLWLIISSRYLDFDQDSDDALHIPSVSLPSLIEWYKVRFLPDSSSRRKLSVHVKSQKATARGTQIRISDVDEFKRKTELTVPVRPMKPLSFYEVEDYDS
ncbi:LuxS/MPP-like metallohydrolase [Gonapodya prolifera JEL478]|uniref:LuxS/MPP-like metallohydrolase n=1 Tax=Gonapodya prolifera (strain JEL478) TaxID=1344416 RepID=A0A138ZY99_GONPJ|nr:LuxS/MPP-like metallohydrolase [Gonapodya prolifera JEL478]|eukprot:KXS09469.1 LuxS/MPP-like metallohydrolase [Gonapodya prolifera JEL478]